MERYEKYKDSGVEWIGEVPEHWNTSALKHLVSTKITDGPHETPTFVLEGIPFASVESVKDGKIDLNYSRGLISPEDDNKFSKKCKPQIHDILMVKSGSTTGKIAIVDFEQDFNIWSPLALIRVNTKISHRFLYYSMLSAYFQDSIRIFWSFGTQPNIGMNIIENLKITYSISIAEQTAIASYLDRKTAEIDQLIADKKRLITLYEEEKTAIINQAVTKGINPEVKMKDSGIEWLGEVPEEWEVKKLKYILQSIVGGGTPSTANSMYWDGDIPWVSAKDMKQDLIFSTQDFITELAIKESSTSFISDERVLIVVRSGILKHTLPVAINKVPVCINQDLKALKPIPQISNDYFFWKLKGMSKDILTFCNKMGATVDSIELTDLMNFPFSFPDIQEQHVIVNHIEMGLNLINDKLQKHQKLIDLLSEYRTALISEVVTGKVRVA